MRSVPLVTAAGATVMAISVTPVAIFIDRKMTSIEQVEEAPYQNSGKS